MWAPLARVRQGSGASPNPTLTLALIKGGQAGSSGAFRVGKQSLPQNWKRVACDLGALCETWLLTSSHDSISPASSTEQNSKVRFFAVRTTGGARPNLNLGESRGGP